MEHIERGDKHSPALDDQLDEGMTPGAPSRSQDWRDPDGGSVDDELMTAGTEPGSPPGMTREDVDGRSDLARHLNNGEFPVNAARVREMADENDAPQALRTELTRLPDAEYGSVTEVWAALGHGVEDDTRRT